jgi:hypothetical protein
MDGGIDTYIYCLPPAGVLHSQNKVIKCAAYGVAIMNRQREEGEGRVYEAYEVKNKRQKLRCLLLRRKKKNIFYLFMKSLLWKKFLNSSDYTTGVRSGFLARSAAIGETTAMKPSPIVVQIGTGRRFL